jgi:hypothetical protein
VYVNVSVSRLIMNGQSRDTDIDIHKKKTLEMGQSRDTDIDIHKKKTLEMGQSGMGNLETSNVFFLCMSMSVSLDCPFLIVLSLTSLS